MPSVIAPATCAGSTTASTSPATPRSRVDIAGEEADLSWPAKRLILELDGGTFHQDKLADARKTAVWRAAGWDVWRLPTDVVYDDPNRLIRAARLDS